ncbi:MAG: hotdog fold thioesterase [Tetrasphaera sp.]
MSTPGQMTIWRSTPSLEVMNTLSSQCLIGRLGIEFVDVGDRHLTARMPVDDRTRQPLGLLHGGASLALAETLASWAASLTVDLEQVTCVGLEINGNHLRPVSSGRVTGVARPVQLGTHVQVWEVEIADDEDRPVCLSRCTIALVSAVVRSPGPDGGLVRSLDLTSAARGGGSRSPAPTPSRW